MRKMTDKRFVIKPSAIVTDGFVIIDKEKKYTFAVLDSTLNYMFCKALNELHEENERLREHFIYLIGTALEDKECRKIYAKGLLEIFEDCSNLDEAKNKIKEYLE